MNPLLCWNWTTHHSPKPPLCYPHVICTLAPSPQKSWVRETSQAAAALIQEQDDDPGEEGRSAGMDSSVGSKGAAADLTDWFNAGFEGEGWVKGKSF